MKTKISKKVLSLFLVLVMVLGMLPIMGTTTALAYTGNGTKSSPYVVTTYDELKSLMQNAPTDNIRYIRLGTDINFSESKNDCSLSLTSSLQRVVLDLYGHTISRSGTTNDEAVINVTVGDLTIQDSIDGGKVVVSMNGGDIKTALLVSGEGKLTVYGGTFDSNGRAIVTRGGNTVINGGTFLGPFYYYTAVFESGVVTVNDGYFCEMDNGLAINITDADVTLNGCTLNGSLSVQTDIWDYIPDNRTALVDNDIAVTPQTYHGKDLKAENGKIEIIFTDGSEKYPYLVSNYIDLKAMMQYAPMDGSVCNIKLASDITFQSNEKNFSLMLISSAQNVVVDLNGHTLTRSGKTEDECIFGVAVGALTIKDSVGGGKVVGIKGDGNLLCNLYVGGNGKLTVDSGTFEAEEGFPLLTFGGTTVINGGTFVTESGKCAAANFINSTATLNGGTFRNNLSINTDEDRSGIWIHKNSNVTVYSCDTLGSIWTDSFDVIAPGISVLGTDKYGTTYSVSDAAALKEAYMLSIGRLISQVAITGIDTPKVGNKPDTSATVNVTGADNAGVTWYDWTDNKTLTSSDVFKVGHDYMVMVTLNAKSGYIFSTTDSNKLNISVNGNKGFLWLANPQRVQCCYNFETLTEPQPVITTQPSGGHSPYMGDSIVLKIDAENANEYIWHIIDEDGNELAWNYLSNNGYATPATSEGGKKLFLYGVSDWMTGKRVYCEVKGNGGTVKSDIVTLSVDKVVKYCMDMYFDNFDEIWNHKTVGDFKNPKNDANAPYTIGNVRWEMFSKILSDDFDFADGDNVAVRIDVIPKEGYTFYSTVFGKLNGIDSYATIKNEDGSRSIVFNMTITTPDEYKTQDIELSVAEPVAGETPATTAVCTSGYVIPETLAWTPADETFKTNTEYTVKIPVKAEYAWGDTSTVTAKVNGKDATFIAEYKGGKQYAYYVEYTFDATGSEIAKDYDITVEGGKAYNSSGEEITKCNEGATVTLKANDAPDGMDFERWEVVSGDVTLADETDPNTTFVMPANEVSVKAIYDLIPHTHIFDLETIKEKALKTPADCENDAVYYKSCSICEEISDTETFTATDSALGHSFKNYVSDNNATCTADGTKTAKCERCDEKDTVTDTDSAKGHKYSEEWSKDTTHHWHQCSVCSDKKDTEEHIPNIAEPTETQAKVCTVCDYVIADKLPAKNGTVIVDSKTVLCIDGTAVEGTNVVNFEGKTYAVVKGYVVTGKIQTVTISGKTYIVDKNGVIIKSGKNRLVKVNSSKWYVVNKYGIVIKAKSGNTLVKVGSKTYIVNKYGLVQKTTKSKLLNVGKKTYVVVKDSVLTGKTRTITISGKTYIVDKTGAVIKSTANKLVKVSKNNWYVVSKAGTVIKAKKGNILVKVSKKSYIVNKKGLVLKNKKSVKVGKKTYKINKYGIATRKK